MYDKNKENKKGFEAWFLDKKKQGREIMRKVEGRTIPGFGYFPWRAYPQSWFWLEEKYGGPKTAELEETYVKILKKFAPQGWSVPKEWEKEHVGPMGRYDQQREG